MTPLQETGPYLPGPCHRAHVSRHRAVAGALLGAVLITASLSPPVFAASPQTSTTTSPQTSPQTTLLHLSATGTVQVPPDLLVAHLTAEFSAPQPGDAQRQLDRRMATAAHLASAAPNISWRLEGYETGRSGENAQGVPQGWTARQILRLESRDGAALLDLVGRLQTNDLAVGDLSWTLSAPRLADAQAAASELALKTLRHRAEAAANALGLKAGTMREVTLGSDDGPVRPMMMRAMSMKAAPRATETSQEVSQSASADIELLP